MNSYVGLAAGGALGALMRHALVVWSAGAFGRQFPYGHFIANVSGSIAIGLLVAVMTSRGVADEWRLFFVSGILGAFTTYSAFSLDTIALLQDGQPLRALLYVGATVACCLLGCWLGITAARFF